MIELVTLMDEFIDDREDEEDESKQIIHKWTEDREGRTQCGLEGYQLGHMENHHPVKPHKSYEGVFFNDDLICCDDCWNTNEFISPMWNSNLNEFF